MWRCKTNGKNDHTYALPLTAKAVSNESEVIVLGPLYLCTGIKQPHSRRQRVGARFLLVEVEGYGEARGLESSTG